MMIHHHRGYDHNADRQSHPACTPKCPAHVHQNAERQAMPDVIPAVSTKSAQLNARANAGGLKEPEQVLHPTRPLPKRVTRADSLSDTRRLSGNGPIVAVAGVAPVARPPPPSREASPAAASKTAFAHNVLHPEEQGVVGFSILYIIDPRHGTTIDKNIQVSEEMFNRMTWTRARIPRGVYEDWMASRSRQAFVRQLSGGVHDAEFVEVMIDEWVSERNMNADEEYRTDDKLVPHVSSCQRKPAPQSSAEMW